MGNVWTHHIKIRPLNSKCVSEYVDIAIHNSLRLEQRGIFIVDIPAKPCVSTGWIHGKKAVPLRDDDVVIQRLMYEPEDTK